MNSNQHNKLNSAGQTYLSFIIYKKINEQHYKCVWYSTCIQGHREQLYLETEWLYRGTINIGFYIRENYPCIQYQASLIASPCDERNEEAGAN